MKLSYLPISAIAMAAQVLAAPTTCDATGPAGQVCTSPGLQVNFYADGSCENYLGSLDYDGSWYSGECLSTLQDSAYGAGIANWNAGLPSCEAFMDTECTQPFPYDKYNQLAIYGVTEAEYTKCISYPAAVRGVMCYWSE